MLKQYAKKKTGLICLALCILMLMQLTACGGALGGAPSGGSQDVAGDGKTGTQPGASGAAQEAPATESAAQTAANAEIAKLFEEGDVSGALKISAYETMQYKGVLDAASQSFNEKYPDVDITVDTFSAMPEMRRQESADGRTAVMSISMEDDPQARSDYANKINTELMSGEGADIYAVDVIPIAKYVESGLLENLAPYMELDPTFNRAEYRENILDAVTWKNGTWFLPMDYMFNYFTYDSTLIPEEEANAEFGYDKAYTTEQLIDIGAPSFDGETQLLNSAEYTKGGGGNGSTWNRMLREHWTDFVDIANKRAHFTDGGFADLLNKVKEYAEKGYIPQSALGQIDREDFMARMRQAPTDRFYFKPKTNMNLMTFFMRDTIAMFNVGYGGGSPAIEDDDEVACISANADGLVPFTYTQAYAVNANSKNKLAAWEFIKFMLSGEMQASGAGGGMLRGLPLHNETRSNQMETMMASMAAGIRGGGAFGGGGVRNGAGANVNGSNGGGNITINPEGGDGGGKIGDSDISGDAGANGVYGANGDGGGKIGDEGMPPPPDSPDGAFFFSDTVDAGGSGGANASGSVQAPVMRNAQGQDAGGDAEGADGAQAADGTQGTVGTQGADGAQGFVGAQIDDGPRMRGPGGQAISPGEAIAEIDPEVYRKYNEAVEQFSNLINTYDIKDSIIDDMIAAEADYFFNGEKTAEEVARTLQSKVELYLNE